MAPRADRRARVAVAVAVVVAVVVAVAAAAALAIGLVKLRERAPPAALRIERVEPRLSIADVVVDTRSGRVALAALAAPTPRAAPTSSERDALLVHLWATWCAPCRDELPALLAAAPEIERRGVRVVLLSVDETWPVIDHYLEELPGGASARPTLIRLNHDAARAAFGFAALPMTALVDGNGKIMARLDGTQPWTRESADDVARAATAAPIE